MSHMKTYPMKNKEIGKFSIISRYDLWEQKIQNDFVQFACRRLH